MRPVRSTLRWTLGAAMIACAVSPARAQDQPDREGRLMTVHGEVAFFEAGQDKGVAARVGLPLQSGDRVVTGPDGTAEIVFDGESALLIGPQTDFKVTSVARATTEFGLLFGSLLAKIKTLAAADTLQVRTPAAVAAVRGTEFGVEQSRDAGDARFAVFDEGQVRVSNAAGAQALGPNEETSVSKGAAPETARPLSRFAAYRRQFSALRAHLASEAGRWRGASARERAQRRERMIREQRHRGERRRLERRFERRGGR